MAEERFGLWTPPDPWKTDGHVDGFPPVLGRDGPTAVVAPTATTARASGCPPDVILSELRK